MVERAKRAKPFSTLVQITPLSLFHKALLFWFDTWGKYIQASFDNIASNPLCFIFFISFSFGRAPQILLSTKLKVDKISLKTLDSWQLPDEIESRIRLKSPPRIKCSKENFSFSSSRWDKSLLSNNHRLEWCWRFATYKL